ncbi:hypothetical protein GCM10009609_02740 [Pseudonocardia aurantiaca]|uniref:PQQ-binding-like beta-propeller repeat protein n=1 Tax=Pseudonocardia aurantiaca TaxID=75290 RepID=A0ABW4FD78_9PSEU
MTVLQAHDPAVVGPYRLLGRLGAGGMGQVFLAHGEDGALVAVKIVHPGLAHDDRFRARFAREVEVSRRVTGPWTAAVLDADPDAPAPWLATEYVAGPALDHAVRAAGPLPAETVHLLAAGLTRALVAIHGMGLLHRDVKPSNVLLAADGARLIDFGIARAVDGAGMTSTGMMIGTPGFMSPEQADGTELGPASDVFSLGAVLVLAATGRGPFGEGGPVAVMRRILDDAPDLGALAEPVRGVVARCLVRDPAARPSAAEMVAALHPEPAIPREGWLPPGVPALLPQQPAPLPPARVAPSGVPAGRVGRRAVLVGAVLAAIGGAVAAVAVGTRLGEAEAERARPRVRWTYTAREDVLVLAADGTRVYAGSADATVHAVDAAGGRPQWTHAVDGLVGALAVIGGAVVASDGARTYALDAGTGGRHWEHDGALLAAGPGGVLVEAFDFAEGGADSRLVRWLDLGTGEQRWQRPHRDTGLAPGLRGVLTSDAVHLAGAGRLLSLDPVSGELLWDRPFAGGPVPAAVAAPSGEALYVGDHADPAAPLVVALDPRTGVGRWQGLHGAGLTELTVGRDTVYAAGGGRVTAWDSAAGDPLWTWTAAEETGGEATSIGPPAVADRVVHVVADAAVGPDARQSSAIALDAYAGTSLWQVDLPRAPTSAGRAGPVVSPDGPVVTAVGTTLYAITAG